jgi:hypothetical protein
MMSTRRQPDRHETLTAVIVAATLVLAGAGTAHAGGGAEEEATTEAPVAAPAPAAEATPEKPPGHLRVKLSGTGAIVDGDVAQFQQRNRVPENFYGGIEEFHYDREIAEDWTLDLDGRAIFDNRDYLLNLKLRNEDKGFFDVGYRQFRTWYDARGGYYPPTGRTFDVIDPETGVDRSEAWARGGVFLPQSFKLTMGYRYLSRTGSKSSTIWGDSTALGIDTTQRNIVPAFYELDEQRHQGEIALERETDVSNVGAALFYEHASIDDKRNVTRSPGQPAERRFTQTDDSESDTIVARTFGSRRLFDDKLTISGAYAYNDIDLDIGGSRIYGSTFHSSFSPTSPNRQQRDEGFFDLTGSTKMREHVGNFSLAARPFENVQVLSALRVRGENRHGEAAFVETNVGASPTFTTTLEDLETESDTDEVSYAEEIEVRYTGIKHLVLHSSALWEQNDGDFAEREIDPVTTAVDFERRTDVDRLIQRYGAGAKVYPLRWLSFSGEYAYRKSDYAYTHRLDSTPNDVASGDRYPAFLVGQQFATHDIGVRTSMRLPHDVSLVLRYDWLQTVIRTRPDNLDSIESAEVLSHVLGGTVTWNPVEWWWTRTGVNYVRSETNTAVDNYDTPVGAFLGKFDNDYVMTTIASGVALDAMTQLELGYNWIGAHNYSDTSALAQPFGSHFDEHDAGFKVTRQLSDTTRVAGGYSYVNYDEAFAGGTWDYDAHIITTSVEFEY